MSRAKNLANFQTTITDGTTSVATSFVTNGSAKVWINFNGTTVTNASDLTGVNDSFSVSSVVDNTSGDVTINFTNNMGNAYYSHLGSAHYDGTTSAIYTFGLRSNTSWSSERTASLIRYQSAYVSATFNRTGFDADENTLTIHGDLA